MINFPSCHNVFDCLKVQKFEIFQDQVLGMLSLQEPFWGRHDSGFKNDITHHHQLRNKPEKYCNVSKIFFHVILFKISIWKSRHGQWINQPTALAVATALPCSIYFNIYLITSPLSEIFGNICIDYTQTMCNSHYSSSFVVSSRLHLHLGLCFNFLKPTRCNNPSHQNENEKTRRRQTVGTLQKKLVLAAAAAAAPRFLFQLQFT